MTQPLRSRIGQGFDVHRLVEGRPLIIGGVRIDHQKGLEGHSDADVLAHAIADALLGAAALGDIGHHFPDTDPAWKDVSSLEILRRVRDLLSANGWRVGNIDATLLAEAPKMAPFIAEMRRRLGAALGAGVDAISIKATTAERLGFAGRGEGIVALAVALIEEAEVIESA